MSKAPVTSYRLIEWFNNRLWKEMMPVTRITWLSVPPISIVSATPPICRPVKHLISPLIRMFFSKFSTISVTSMEIFVICDYFLQKLHKTHVIFFTFLVIFIDFFHAYIHQIKKLSRNKPFYLCICQLWSNQIFRKEIEFCRVDSLNKCIES